MPKRSDNPYDEPRLPHNLGDFKWFKWSPLVSSGFSSSPPLVSLIRSQKSFTRTFSVMSLTFLGCKFNRGNSHFFIVLQERIPIRRAHCLKRVRTVFQLGTHLVQLRNSIPQQCCCKLNVRATVRPVARLPSSWHKYPTLSFWSGGMLAVT